jgi:arylsulfatase
MSHRRSAATAISAAHPRRLPGLLVALVCVPLCALAPGACSAPAPPSAIVLVVVDTLRADHLGSYGYARPTTPQLDAWVARGRRYERCLATSPWTLPSFVSILTGRLPSRVVDLEARGLSGLDLATPLLSELLAAEGFSTGAIMNNAFLTPQLGFQRGFGDYDWKAGSNLKIRRADAVVDRALAWLDDHEDEPLLLVVHLFDPHMAYDAPEPVRGRFTGGSEPSSNFEAHDVKFLREHSAELPEVDRRYMAAAYDEEIAFVDGQLARLLSGLEERGLLDRGIALLTSDHGEELFEHDGFEHGHALWHSLLHVPLVLWGDSVTPGTDDTPVSLADLTPTLLGALEIQAPDALDGRSIWPSARGDEMTTEPLFAEGILYGPQARTIVRWPYKLVSHLASGEVLLFDLESDPGERRDLSKTDPERVASLSRDLDARLGQGARGPGDAAPIDLDAATREKLRSLGYIE